MPPTFRALYSRKKFLQISLLAGTGLWLVGCNPSAPTVKTPQTNLSPPPDTLSQAVAVDQPTTLVLIKQDDPRYNSLRNGFNKRIDQHPAVIALCTTTQEVAEAIVYANKQQLPVAVKSGGHSMEGFSGNDGGMVINLSAVNSVEFLADDLIKVGPGCTLSRLYDHILPQKRLIPAGSCATVGIGGVTLGGGYGLFARQYGLTCDHLVEATMVDGLGTIHNTRNNPELLWALRGGGAGNFGIVTELVFRSHPAPATMQSYHFKALNLDAARATDLLQKWFALAEQLPNTCFSGYVLNGKTLSVLVTNFAAHTPALQSILAQFALATDTFKSGQPTELAQKLKSYYGQLEPLYFKNSSAGYYKKFDDIAGCIEAVFAKITQTKGMIYQLNTMGGNIQNAEAEKNACYPHRSYNFIAELQAYWEKPAQETPLKVVSEQILDIFKQHGIMAQYINYCSLYFDDWQTAYYGNHYARLQAIKQQYDPNNTIRHPQSVELPA